jgi:hypothetical protein
MKRREQGKELETGFPRQREEHVQKPGGGNELSLFGVQEEGQCGRSSMDGQHNTGI